VERDEWRRKAEAALIEMEELRLNQQAKVGALEGLLAEASQQQQQQQAAEEQKAASPVKQEGAARGEEEEAELRNRVAENSALIQSLQERIAEHEEQDRARSTSTVEKSEERQSLKVKVADLEDSLSDVTRAWDETEADRERLRKECSSLQQTVQDLRKQISAMKEQAEREGNSRQTLATDSHRRIEELKTALDTANARVERLNKDSAAAAAEAAARIASLEKQLLGARKDAQESEQRDAEEIQMLRIQVQQLEEMTAELDALRKEVNTLRATPSRSVLSSSPLPMSDPSEETTAPKTTSDGTDGSTAAPAPAKDMEGIATEGQSGEDGRAREIATLQERIQQLEKSVHEKEGMLEKYKKFAHKKISDLTTDLTTKLHKAEKSLYEAREQQYAASTAAEARIAELQQQMASLEQQAFDAEQQLRESKEAQGQEIARLQEEISLLQIQMQETQASALQVIESERSTLADKVRQLELELYMNDGALNAAKKEAAKADDELRRYKSRAQVALQQKETQLSGQLQLLKDELMAAQQEAKRLSDEKQSWEANVQVEVQKVQKLAAELEEREQLRREEVGRLQTALDRTLTDMETQRNSTALVRSTAEAESVRLRAQLEQLRDKVERQGAESEVALRDMKVQLKVAEKKNKELTAELTRVQQTAATATRTYGNLPPAAQQQQQHNDGGDSKDSNLANGNGEEKNATPRQGSRMLPSGDFGVMLGDSVSPLKLPLETGEQQVTSGQSFKRMARSGSAAGHSEPGSGTATPAGSTPRVGPLFASDTEILQGLLAAEHRAKAKDGRQVEVDRLLSEIQELQFKIVQMEEAMSDKDELERLLLEQLQLLKREVAALSLERNRVDLTYLKNIVLKYMETGEHDSLLPPIAMVLQFSPDELQRVKSPAWRAALSGSSFFSW